MNHKNISNIELTKYQCLGHLPTESVKPPNLSMHTIWVFSKEAQIGNWMNYIFPTIHSFMHVYLRILNLLECPFGTSWKFQLIYNFSLFLLLFMSYTALFCIIHRSHCTIQLTFTFIYSTFSKIFSVSTK